MIHGAAGLSATIAAIVTVAVMGLFSENLDYAEPAPPAAATTPAAVPATPPEYVEVTATRIPESVETIPASVTIVTGDDLRNRGARDLRGALALVVGLDIAPGGDVGPASFVPELWGLKEFDAFLLVVDGIPWGGAFNPALATVDLRDIERIEVMRGPAPVMYGATSFVGVIQVIRLPAGSGRPAVSASAGSYTSGSIAVRVPLPLDASAGAGIASTLLVDLEQVGFRDDRTQFDREHVLWRANIPALSGNVRLDVEGIWVQQDPASPVPRQGSELSPLIPLDANYNPDGSKLDEQRLVLTAGYDRLFGSTRWVTTLSGSHSTQDVIRGFLTDVSNTDPNANGFRQTITLTDVYFDSHLELTGSERLHAVFGIDDIYGNGDGDGGDFDYFVNLDGDNPPSGSDIPFGGTAKVSGTRNYAGLYGQVEWFPASAWRFDLGLRLNRTAEDRKTTSQEIGVGSPESSSDSQYHTRGSGTAGITWTPWEQGPDAVHLYVNASNTFKPAAFDFGLDAEPEILEPETATDIEGGAKWTFAEGRIHTGLSAFQMDFNNLVVSADVNGVPTLENAGESRLRGIEADVAWQMHKDLMMRVAYSLHDARFTDYVTLFDGIPTQLSGNRLEMSARYMAAAGLIYAPARAWNGSVQVNWVGSRYLNKRNTALTPDYITWAAGIGYRWSKWELRLDGININDQRPPVIESELGESQYYLLTARRIVLTANYQF